MRAKPFKLRLCVLLCARPTYNLTMDKYSGCNIVDSVVTAPPKPVKTVKRRGLASFLARAAVAAVAVGFMCLLRYGGIAAMQPVRDVAHDVLCYDVFGRDGFGETPVLEQIFGAKQAN